MSTVGNTNTPKAAASSQAPAPVTIKTPTGNQWQVPPGIFINNAFHPSASGKTFDSINPATGEKLCTLSLGGAADIEAAVKAARTAFNTVWGKKSTPTQRSRLLLNFADLVDKHLDELAELESMDNGKPLWMANSFDVPDSAGCLRYYGGLADKIEGKTIEQTEGEKIAYTRIEPLGICGQIIPWNYPIQMAAWKLGPALAAGNCVILKPAEQTPVTALKLAQLPVEAGHMDIQKVAFTGSTAKGKRIMKAAAESNMKKVTLELGGKSPVVVFDSADIEQAVRWVCMGILFNQGQDCTAGSRLFVQDKVYDNFMQQLITAFQAHKVGDPFHKLTFQGPQVSKIQQDKIPDMIESGKRQGAKVEVGGKAWSSPEARFKKGFFIEPTIFSGCRKGMRIVDEEIFGPVLAVANFSTEEEAIRLANETEYGLGAGVFSENASQIQRMVSAIDAGTVWVNNYVALSNSVPFGGMKASGFGRELGVDAIKAYCDVKAIHWNYGEKLDWPLPKL
ncbi:probable aldehyde dehydrogenase [Ustilago bromivora]|nr:probable aldehyde dehydrogenase [Ustilago bromivora]